MYDNRSKCDLERRACKEGFGNRLTVAFSGICHQCQAVYWDGEPTGNDRYCDGRCEHCSVRPFEKPVCDTFSKIVYKNQCFAKCAEGNHVVQTQPGTCSEELGKFKKNQSIYLHWELNENNKKIKLS